MDNYAFEELMDIIRTDWLLREELAFNWWDGVCFVHELLADDSKHH